MQAKQPFCRLIICCIKPLNYNRKISQSSTTSSVLPCHQVLSTDRVFCSLCCRQMSCHRWQGNSMKSPQKKLNKELGAMLYVSQKDWWQYQCSHISCGVQVTLLQKPTNPPTMFLRRCCGRRSIKFESNTTTTGLDWSWNVNLSNGKAMVWQWTSPVSVRKNTSQDHDCSDSDRFYQCKK